MPERKLCRHTVNVWQVVSALVIGYIHSDSILSVADIPIYHSANAWMVKQLTGTFCTFLLQPTLTLLKLWDWLAWRSSKSALCQDDHFDDKWTLSGWSQVCVLIHHTHGLEVQLFSWSNQTITVVFLSDHLLSYILTSIRLCLQTTCTHQPNLWMHRDIAWSAFHLLL